MTLSELTNKVHRRIDGMYPTDTVTYATVRGDQYDLVKVCLDNQYRYSYRLIHVECTDDGYNGDSVKTTSLNSCTADEVAELILDYVVNSEYYAEINEDHDKTISLIHKAVLGIRSSILKTLNKN